MLLPTESPHTEQMMRSPVFARFVWRSFTLIFLTRQDRPHEKTTWTKLHELLSHSLVICLNPFYSSSCLLLVLHMPRGSELSLAKFSVLFTQWQYLNQLLLPSWIFVKFWSITITQQRSKPECLVVCTIQDMDALAILLCGIERNPRPTHNACLQLIKGFTPKEIDDVPPAENSLVASRWTAGNLNATVISVLLS